MRTRVHYNRTLRMFLEKLNLFAQFVRYFSTYELENYDVLAALPIYNAGCYFGTGQF